ncbi:hypothetical protein HDU67_002106 [Dinochytrium kinnereticum]|nr:hypothetical protein HDU67_002106 [Dinochytrium kinnereticum]
MAASASSRRLFLAIIALALLFGVAHANHPQQQHQAVMAVGESELEEYEGHRLVRVQMPLIKDRRKEVERLVVEKLGLDVWAGGKDGLDIRVSPKDHTTLTLALRNLTFTVRRPKILVRNLQHLIQKERVRLQSSETRLQSLSKEERYKDWFSEYHRFDDIKEWFQHLAAEHKDLIQLIPSIGKTALGEDIFALRVGSAVGKGVKPQFWFHSGDHAREWIGPATMQYLVHRLVTQYGKETDATTMLDSAELIVVPLMNADGYKYTWDKSRLWRKSRRPIKSDLFGSVGVDLNRNWPAHWGEGGSSTSPYSDVYMGPSAGSEPEVKALMSFFMSPNHTRLLGAIDFHSYSQLVLRPYGWTEEPAPDEKQLKKVGDGIRDVIKATHGKKYTSEREIDLYQCSGTASDWFYDDDVQKWLPDRRLYAYTIELRPSADETWGNQGFILPPEFIVPTGEEIYASMVYFVQYAIANPLWVKK